MTMNKWVRGIVFVCGLLLIPVLMLPMWRIELTAPQYPEGLVLQIFPGKLGGDVEIVNGLNHYIGMKTLHAEEFIEFTVLPYIIGFFILLFFGAAIANRRVFLYFCTALFLIFAVVAMADFWRWEYAYGHDLDPNAAIQVPGMSYQPPFLGYKQLLNFGAFSIPDSGGWIFAGVGALLLSITIIQVILGKRTLNSHRAFFSLLLISVSLNSCNNAPEPISVGKDSCTFCKMTISDSRFGAEAVTEKGKAYKFDDIQCLVKFIKYDNHDFEGADYYFTDFKNKHTLVKSTESFLLRSEEFKTPMGSNIVAFSSSADLEDATAKFGAERLNWNDLVK